MVIIGPFFVLKVTQPDGKWRASGGTMALPRFRANVFLKSTLKIAHTRLSVWPHLVAFST